MNREERGERGEERGEERGVRGVCLHVKKTAVLAQGVCAMTRNFGAIKSYRSDAQSEWDADPKPLRTSYQIELAAERKRKWIRRAVVTANVMLWGGMFAAYLLSAPR